MVVDGTVIAPINGPYSGVNYSCPIGTWAAGGHAYTITSTDSLGGSSSSSGTFTVIAPIVVPPSITNVVVAEVTPKNGVLESNENLKITWTATSRASLRKPWPWTVR